MKSNKTTFTFILGALVLLALMAFQGPVQKMGVVNLSEMAEKSKIGVREKRSFDELRGKIGSLLQFINGNRVMTRDQATKLRELWLEEKPTAEQQKELEALKTIIQTTSDELRTLLGKLNPDEKDRARISELSPLANATEDLLPTLDVSYGNVMRGRAEEKQQEVLGKARAAVQKLGKRDGYAMIFEINSAPYGANDVTNDALKIMDGDNP